MCSTALHWCQKKLEWFQGHGHSDGIRGTSVLRDPLCWLVIKFCNGETHILLKFCFTPHWHVIVKFSAVCYMCTLCTTSSIAIRDVPLYTQIATNSAVYPMSMIDNMTFTLTYETRTNCLTRMLPISSPQNLFNNRRKQLWMKNTFFKCCQFSSNHIITGQNMGIWLKWNKLKLLRIFSEINFYVYITQEL